MANIPASTQSSRKIVACSQGLCICLFSFTCKVEFQRGIPVQSCPFKSESCSGVQQTIIYR